MVSKALFSSNKDEWATPQWLFDELNEEFKFVLDPCSTTNNKKCQLHFDKEKDGLQRSWIIGRLVHNSNPVDRKLVSDGYGSVFVNPPFSQKAKWIKKSYEESLKGCTVVMLIDARTDTKVWHDIVFPNASEIRFIKGRVKFIDENGNSGSAPFPSAIVVFRPPKAQGKLKYFVMRRK